MSHTLVRTDHGRVTELVFTSGANNHATVGLLKDIGAALAEIDADPTISATVLASDGKPFCGGADLATPGGFGTDSADPIRKFYDQALTIFAAKKPIVAAIQGAAVGAGLGLAVSADFRVASPEARFVGNFTRLGFHPGFGLTVTLPRLIGRQRALEMFMTSARYKPEEVADWGLVDRLVGNGEAREGAHALAAEITENAPLALVATRATLKSGLLEQVRAALAHEHGEQAKLRATEDYAEGVASVFERRAANFKGALTTVTEPERALPDWGWRGDLPMPARAYWKGQLRLALVSIPVEIYAATKSGATIAFRQIHEPSGKPIKYEKTAAGVGPVDVDDIVKGYEISKGNFVLLEDKEIEAVKIESRKTLELVRFVAADDIDVLYYEKPYFVVPTDELAEEAYIVLREAMRASKKVGVGQLSVRGREQLVSIKPCGRGMVMELLRYADEVQKAQGYFRDIPDSKPDADLLDLASTLIDKKTGPFKPEDFSDRYIDGLKRLVEKKSKAKGKLVIEDADDAPAQRGGNIIDLMAALKKSVGEGGAPAKPATKPAAKATKAAAAKPKAPARKRA